MLFAVEPILHLLSPSKSTLFNDASSYSPTPPIVSTPSPADAIFDRIFKVTTRNFTEASPLHLCSSKTLFSDTTAALLVPFSNRISYPMRFTSMHRNGKRGHCSRHHPAMVEERHVGFFLSNGRSFRPFDLNIQMATTYGSDPVIATIHAILASLADRLLQHQQQSFTVPPFRSSSDRDPPSSASTVRAGSSPTSLASTAHVGSHSTPAATTVQVGYGKAIPFDTPQPAFSRHPQSGSMPLGIIRASDDWSSAIAAGQSTFCTHGSETTFV